MFLGGPAGLDGITPGHILQLSIYVVCGIPSIANAHKRLPPFWKTHTVALVVIYSPGLLVLVAGVACGASQFC